MFVSSYFMKYLNKLIFEDQTLNKLQMTTLIATNSMIHRIKFNESTLVAEIKRIILSKQYIMMPDLDKILSEDRLSRIKKLFKCYHIAYPDLNIHHDSFQRLENDNSREYAIFLDAQLPPTDFYDDIMIVSDHKLMEINSNIPIRTKIRGLNRDLVGLIVRSSLISQLLL